MTEKVVTFDIDDAITTLCKQLTEKPFRHVPVLLGGQTPGGIITRVDLIRVYKDRFRPRKAASRVSPDSELQEAG